MQLTPYSCYIAFIRLIGLCNLGVEPETGRLLLHDVPSMVYCLLLNLAYMLMLPVVFGVLLETAYRCDLGLVTWLSKVIVSAKLWSVLLVLIDIWLHRRRLHWINAQYMRLLQQYERCRHSCVQQVAQMRRRCLLKLAMSSARFLMVIVQLYGQDSAMECLDDGVTPPNTYVLCSLFMLLMELLLSSVDFTVYASAAATQLLLQFMWQDAQHLVRAAQLAASWRAAPVLNWERKLYAAWQRLCRHYACLDRLAESLFLSFQWQLLISLGSRYLAGIAALFSLALNAIGTEYDDDDLNVWLFLLDLSIFVAIYADILVSLGLFDVMKVQSQLLLEQFWQLSLVVQPLTVARPAVPLSRQIEFTLLLLGRKLHKGPQRVRRLHVAGLFDLSNGTAFGMFASMVGNCLVLCQMAVKELAIET